MADAVAVCCIEVAGNEKIEITKSQFGELNTTAIGNMAFIALNHSDEGLKKALSRYNKEVERMESRVCTTEE